MGVFDFVRASLKRLGPVFSAIAGAKPPAILYHYTKMPGLLGIVASKALWATDIRYLNDEKEFQHALDITRDLLAELRGSNSAYVPIIPSLLASMDNLDASGIFVTCFTGNGDLLSQWRGYCGPEVGCSIGWSGEILRAAALKAGFMLAPCIYDRDKQRHLVRWLLDSVFTEEPQRVLGDADAASFVHTSLALIAPLFKHPSFQEEAEWRFFTRPHKSARMPLQFRSGRAAIIPYVQIPLKTARDTLADVERIVVGPSPLPILSARAIRSCLTASGIHVNEVVPSTAPYRSV